ncbi:MAG: GntR family transcriptional regulator [Nodosilinea sp.]
MILSSSPTINRSKSLYEQVYHALRSAILAGELPPGDRLVETQVAEWLHVSRTPLREALRQLQQDGLVTADVSGGLRVTTITAADAEDLYDCRLALESIAVAGACTHATPAQMQAIAACVAEAEGEVTGQHGDFSPERLLSVDYRFHHLIAESSGNRRLVSLLDTLFDAMALLRIQTLQQNPGVLEIRLEHRQIYEAILSNDSDIAVTTITQHLRASKARVVREIKGSQTAVAG